MRKKLFPVSIMFICTILIGIYMSTSLFNTSAYGSGTTYFVSPLGNDSNTGDINKPFKTIAKGVSVLKPGDTLMIREGSYSGKIIIPVSGTSGNFITIQNYNSEKVVIDGSNGNGDGIINIENKNYIRIKGLHLCNNSKGDPPAGVFVIGSGSGIEIINNKIYNIKSNRDAHGIAIYGTNGSKSINQLIISGNEVFNCQLGSSESVVVNGNVDGFLISDNIIHDNNNIGIDCIGFEGTAPSNDQARNGIVRCNTIYNITSVGNPAYGSDACADGIYVDGGKDIIIERNRVSKCDIGIEIASEHKDKITNNVIVRNNVVYNSGWAGIVMGGAGSGNGYADNCKFYNNTLYNNNVGICIQKTKTNIIKNNIIYGNNLLEGAIGTNQISNNIWFSKSESNSKLDKFIDPKFTNTSNYDFHLQPGSPAINSGDPQYKSEQNEYDFDGKIRIADGIIDCGAFEFGSNNAQTSDGTVNNSAVINTICNNNNTSDAKDIQSYTNTNYSNNISINNTNNNNSNNNDFLTNEKDNDTANNPYVDYSLKENEKDDNENDENNEDNKIKKNNVEEHKKGHCKNSIERKIKLLPVKTIIDSFNAKLNNCDNNKLIQIINYLLYKIIQK